MGNAHGRGYQPLHPPRPPPLPPPAFDVLGVIGSGAHGVVTKRRLRETGELIAVKAVPYSLWSHDRRARVTREARVLESLVHAHVVRFRGVWLKPGPLGIHGEVLIGMELCAGSLADLFAESPGRAHALRLCVLEQCAAALAHCHACGVLHRDLKLENVLYCAADAGVGARAAGQRCWPRRCCLSMEEEEEDENEDEKEELQQRQRHGCAPAAALSRLRRRAVGMLRTVLSTPCFKLGDFGVSRLLELSAEAADAAATAAGGAQGAGAASQAAGAAAAPLAPSRPLRAQPAATPPPSPFAQPSAQPPPPPPPPQRQRRGSASSAASASPPLGPSGAALSPPHGQPPARPRSASSASSASSLSQPAAPCQPPPPAAHGGRAERAARGERGAMAAAVSARPPLHPAQPQPPLHPAQPQLPPQSAASRAAQQQPQPQPPPQSAASRAAQQQPQPQPVAAPAAPSARLASRRPSFSFLPTPARPRRRPPPSPFQTAHGNATSLVGTPLYMAAEAFADPGPAKSDSGGSGAATPRADDDEEEGAPAHPSRGSHGGGGQYGRACDLYSLGCVYRELLTSTRLHESRRVTLDLDAHAAGRKPVTVPPLRAQRGTMAAVALLAACAAALPSVVAAYDSGAEGLRSAAGGAPRFGGAAVPAAPRGLGASAVAPAAAAAGGGGLGGSGGIGHGGGGSGAFANEHSAGQGGARADRSIGALLGALLPGSPDALSAALAAALTPAPPAARGPATHPAATAAEAAADGGGARDTRRRRGGVPLARGRRLRARKRAPPPPPSPPPFRAPRPARGGGSGWPRGAAGGAGGGGGGLGDAWRALAEGRGLLLALSLVALSLLPLVPLLAVPPLRARRRAAGRGDGGGGGGKGGGGGWGGGLRCRCATGGARRAGHGCSRGECAALLRRGCALALRAARACATGSAQLAIVGFGFVIVLATVLGDGSAWAALPASLLVLAPHAAASAHAREVRLCNAMLSDEPASRPTATELAAELARVRGARALAGGAPVAAAAIGALLLCVLRETPEPRQWQALALACALCALLVSAAAPWLVCRRLRAAEVGPGCGACCAPSCRARGDLGGGRRCRWWRAAR